MGVMDRCIVAICVAAIATSFYRGGVCEMDENSGDTCKTQITMLIYMPDVVL